MDENRAPQTWQSKVDMKLNLQIWVICKWGEASDGASHGIFFNMYVICMYISSAYNFKVAFDIWILSSSNRNRNLAYYKNCLPLPPTSWPQVSPAVQFGRKQFFRASESFFQVLMQREAGSHTYASLRHGFLHPINPSYSTNPLLKHSSTHNT